MPDPETPTTCPVDHKSRQTWLQVASSSSQQSQNQQQQQQPHPSRPTPKITNQRLGTDRQISSIPRGGLPSPAPSPSSPHSSSPEPSALQPSPNAQTSNPTTSPQGNWVYPSESQFYAALARKHPPEDVPEQTAIPNIIPIHNAVNERTWLEILGWERGEPLHRRAEKGRVEKNDGREPDEQTTAYPKLVSFSGELKHRLTPRARLYTILGYQRPFDRHDWVVERDATGKRVEYVIDFYAGRAGATKTPVSFYLDVRPKLNSWEGLRMRVWRAVWWR